MPSRLALALCLAAPIVSLAFAGCDQAAINKMAASAVNGGGAEDESFESPEEKTYTLAGRPFAEAVAKEDWPAAYAMLSSHARARYSNADGLRAVHELQRQAHFQPLSADEAYAVEMDPGILAGQVDPGLDQMDQAFAKMSIARYVGDVPADVPADIRRAALAAAMHSVADIETQEGQTMDLTYLLVEEAGELKVAHWFYRPHDMLD